MYNSSALDQYKSVDVDSRVGISDPHTLISMLLEGAMKKLVLASSAIARGDINGKIEAMNSAIRIVDSLRAALDHSRGGELAENLEALYSYMERRLTQANRQNDTTILSEVKDLLSEIKEGWDGIPQEMRVRG